MKIKDESDSSNGVLKKKHGQGLPVFNPFAGGIDVGDTMFDVAISDGIAGYEVREYSTFTEDTVNLVNWLVAENITTVAMEATGIYWLNLYLMLEEAGIEPYLVNAKHVKNVTGRKKDDTDAIWLQKLHTCGLLKKSFQPDSDIRELRTYMRQRKNLINIASDSVRRMQKAMELMNLKLHVVISDILGKTGLQMVCAILKGERNPDELIKLKDPRIKATDQEIKKSLTGIWRQEYLFMLKQAYEEYSFYQSQIASCEEKIKECLLKQVAQITRGDITDIGLEKKKRKKNQFNVEIRPVLKIIAGVDLCDIDGINEISALELISEIGVDMSKWENNKHLSAWCNVAPNTKITGGKIISSKMQKKKNRAGQVLRMSASGLYRSKSGLGDYARKMRSRLGKRAAVVAIAHKLALIIYTMIKEKRPYNPQVTSNNQEQWKAKRIKYLEKQLLRLKNVA